MEVFVYGTLTDPETAASLLETFESLGPATLVGLHRVDGRYPTLAPGGASTRTAAPVDRASPSY